MFHRNKQIVTDILFIYHTLNRYERQLYIYAVYISLANKDQQKRTQILFQQMPVNKAIIVIIYLPWGQCNQ